LRDEPSRLPAISVLADEGRSPVRPHSAALSFANSMVVRLIQGARFGGITAPSEKPNESERANAVAAGAP